MFLKIINILYMFLFTGITQFNEILVFIYLIQVKTSDFI